MNDCLLKSSMGSAQDFTPGQLMIRERSLWVWLLAWSEPKLRADLDAPVGNDEQTGMVEAVHTVDTLASTLSPFAAGAGSAHCPTLGQAGAQDANAMRRAPDVYVGTYEPPPVLPICPVCHDTGVRSYHELPGAYGREPCGECEE